MARAKLLSAGLVHKQSMTLKGGGYYHIYMAMEVARIMEQARHKVKEITAGLERLIDNFESDRCKYLEAE